MRKEMERLGIDEEKISTFSMGVDEAFYEEGRNRQKKLDGSPLTILSNRNLLGIYNVSLLIRAIPMVLKEEPKARFLIAGDGPERKNLEKETKDLNLGSTIQFLGRISHDAMPGLLTQADIYVSTSLYDGTSISLLEAMASGAFPVVTDIPSNREWVTDGENGFLIPTDEEKFLAERIVEAIRDQELLERGRLKNFYIVKKKALWPITIEKVKEIYTGLLSSKN
jgi:glycosyltransferase involved in cell wall biosynthesis